MKKVYIIFASVIFLSIIIFLSHQLQQPVSVEEIKEKQKIEIISAEKPESFKGVELVTYKSFYGYEITYPKEWIFKNITKDYVRSSLEVIEVKPKEIDDLYFFDETFTISVEKKSLENFKKEIYLGKNIFIKDVSELKPVFLNNMSGLKKDLRSPGAYYFFERDEKLFWVTFLYDPLMDISEQEALWVLSTFRLVD